MYFLVIKFFKERTKLFLNISKEKWIIKVILFLKKIIKELSKVNLILFFRLREVYKSSETKKEKDSIIPNQIIHESFSQIRSTNWTNYLLTEKKIKDLTDRTSTIRNQIERITKEKNKVTPGINISPNKPSYNAKRFESPKNIWQILKSRNARLIRKLHYFIKIFIERIYRDILLSIINISRINIQLFLESTKKIIDKSIYNNKTNQEIINKTKKNKNTIHFISTIKKSLYNISNKNSQNFCDLSSLSQAYVFFKLSQTQVLNLYKLRSILQYHGTSFFLKTSIKDYFGTQGIIHSELKHKKLWNSGINQWKTWLRGHYQYNLSQISWSRLIAQKWRNRINQCRTHTIQNQDLNKENSYEKDQLIHYKKQNDYKVYSLPNQKDNLKKYYRYNLLSYRSINYENKRDPYIYGLPFQINKNQESYSNSNTHKGKLFDILKDIPIHNYLGKSDIIYMEMEKSPDRKYFDWKIINFCLRKKFDIEAWIKIDTNSNKNTKTGLTNYQIINKIDKKDLFYLTIHQNQEMNLPNQKKKKLDWMGMNEEILSRPISNLELWFFPEFVLLYNTYKIKPWFIPSKLLFLNLNINENVSKNKNINRKQQGILPSNEKKSFELKNQNQKEKESAGQRDLRSNAQNQGNLVSVLSNQQKNIEEDYSESDMKKRKQKKQYKSNTEAELDFFLKRYLLFQLRWDDGLNQRMINNIQVYCLLLRLRKPRNITISSIQRREMNLDIMPIQKNLPLTELMKRGILIIEPLRLFVKNNGQFIMYQTIGISLVHKSRHQTNQRYQEQRYIDKKDFNEFIPRNHQRITKNRDKNHYDLLVPENILSSRRRRELRILICFNSKTKYGVDRNPIFCNRNKVKNGGQFLDENKDLDRDKLIKLKFFLWPNYRLEDLACMNRYWFDTNNGSRFSMLRIHIYHD